MFVTSTVSTSFHISFFMKKINKVGRKRSLNFLFTPALPEEYFTLDFANLFEVSLSTRGMRWRSLLRHWATSRKVAGSIGISCLHNPSGSTMVLGSIPPPTKMSIWNISWGVKAAGT